MHETRCDLETWSQCNPLWLTFPTFVWMRAQGCNNGCSAPALAALKRKEARCQRQQLSYLGQRQITAIMRRPIRQTKWIPSILIIMEILIWLCGAIQKVPIKSQTMAELSWSLLLHCLFLHWLLGVQDFLITLRGACAGPSSTSA